MSDRRSWTSAETRRACDLRMAGQTLSAIGVELGRSERSIESVLRRAGYVSQTGRWSDEDQQRAIEMRRAGRTNAYIGGELNRSADAVAMMFSALRKAGKDVPSLNKRAARASVVWAKQRAEKAAQPQRKCLSCGTMFPSEGPGNRRCTPCKDTDTWRGSAW